MTLAGIETATFQFVAQRLNHCATAVPLNIHKSKMDLLGGFFEGYDKYRFFLRTLKRLISFQSVSILRRQPSVTAHRRPASQQMCGLYFSFLSKTSTRPHELATFLSRTVKCSQKHGTKTLKGDGRSSEGEWRG